MGSAFSSMVAVAAEVEILGVPDLVSVCRADPDAGALWVAAIAAQDRLFWAISSTARAFAVFPGKGACDEVLIAKVSVGGFPPGVVCPLVRSLVAWVAWVAWVAFLAPPFPLLPALPIL